MTLTCFEKTRTKCTTKVANVIGLRDAYIVARSFNQCSTANGFHSYVDTEKSLC